MTTIIPNAVGWRDMSSAPTDGDAILIYRPSVWPEEQFHVVFWHDDGWEIHDGKIDHFMRGSTEPTHWMPLPPPPSSNDTLEMGK